MTQSTASPCLAFRAIPMHPQREIVGAPYQDHRRWRQGWLGGGVGCRETAADLPEDTFPRLPQGRDLWLRPRGLSRQELQEMDAFLRAL